MASDAVTVRHRGVQLTGGGHVGQGAQSRGVHSAAGAEDVDPALSGGDCGHGDVFPSVPDRGQCRRRDGGGIEKSIGAVGENLPDGRAEICVARAHHGSGAKLEGVILLVVTDNADNGKAARGREFDGEAADAAGGAGDDKSLVGGQLQVGKATPGGEPVQPDGGELGGRKAIRGGHHVPGRQGDQLGLGPAQALEPEAEPEHTRPGNRGAGADRHDASDQVPPRRVRPGDRGRSLASRRSGLRAGAAGLAGPDRGR